MKHLGLLFVFLFFSCQYFQPKLEEGKVLAIVGELELNSKDLNGLIPTGLSKEDSTSFVKKFVLEWVNKQLMIQKASEVFNFNEAKINRKVLDYRYALMIHEYQQDYIRQNLQKDVSEEEIEKYYAEKGQNFILRENLAKLIFVKVAKRSPNLRRLRNYVKNYPTDSVALKEYTDNYAEKVFLDVDIWVKFNEVLIETPLNELNDKKSFLTKNTFVEVADKTFSYFIKIEDKKLIGEQAPLEYIYDNIVEILINKRKIELKNELERRIYDEATESNAFKIIGL